MKVRRVFFSSYLLAACLGVGFFSAPLRAAAPEASPPLAAIQVQSHTFTPDGPAQRELRVAFRSPVESSRIRIRVYDYYGRIVARPVPEGAGPDYVFRWDGSRPDGRRIAGIYVFEIFADGKAAHRAAVVLAR